MSYQDYAAFLAGKRASAPAVGIDVPESALNPMLFPFQRDVVRWALKRGRAAIWADCGLGKGPMSLAWSDVVSRHAERPVLILAPLAVSQQFVREGEKFGIPVTICRAQADVRPGVNVTNYEMLQHFDAASFGGVVLDESSCLKAYMGSLKRALVESFRATPYRLCCTATPAPNDHMELGNHAEFLGVMRSTEMLMRWFINDTNHMGTYRLKRHAVRDFWQWVATWAAGFRRPSDLGYADDGYDLPPLSIEQVTVGVDLTRDAGDQLFRHATLNATSMHREMRLTAPERAAAVAARVNASRDTWIVWCNTNYEADALMSRLPDAVEVRGNESAPEKERKLTGFVLGEYRVLVSKPTIAGYGLNFQHCHHVAFVGLSWSFEQFYQAVRRTYRFGQAHPVEAFVVVAETEGQLLTALHAKMRAYDEMMAGLYAATRRGVRGEDLSLTADLGAARVTVPDWIASCQ